MALTIIDFNRTMYDPDTDTLVSGAIELLTALSRKDVRMVLLSRKEGGRADTLARLGAAHFFAEAVFVENKTAGVLKEIMDRHGAAPEDTYVLGDYLHQEIRAGNEAGAYTIHFKVGKFASLEPESDFDVPNAVIAKLEEAIPLIG